MSIDAPSMLDGDFIFQTIAPRVRLLTLSRPRSRAAPRRSLEALRLAALAVDFSHSLATGTEIEERTATLAASHLLAD